MEDNNWGRIDVSWWGNTQDANRGRTLRTHNQNAHCKSNIDALLRTHIDDSQWGHTLRTHIEDTHWGRTIRTHIRNARFMHYWWRINWCNIQTPLHTQQLYIHTYTHPSIHTYIHRSFTYIHTPTHPYIHTYIHRSFT